MADDDRKLSITYSSGLIPPPEYMSTLAMFYDEIWLPNPYELDLEKSEELGEEYTFLTQSLAEQGEEHKEALKLAQEEFYRLKTRWSTLYKESLLRTLSPVTLVDLELENAYIPKNIYFEYFNTKSLRNLISKGVILDNVVFDLISVFMLCIQCARNDKPSPELFISKTSDTSTSRLAGFLVDAIFQYQVPQLKTLNAEQILDTRYQLRNFKEGFSDYIYELTHEVEQLLLSGVASKVIATEKIIERKFATKHREFQRQLEPRNLNTWAKIGASIGTFLTVFLVPPSPALIGAILAMYCGTLAASSERWIREKSNQEQAFKFIAKLESEVSKRIP